MLVGVTDRGAVILVFGLNAMMTLFAIMMELHNQTTAKTGTDCAFHKVGEDANRTK
jgi:hypothetical protein